MAQQRGQESVGALVADGSDREILQRGRIGRVRTRFCFLGRLEAHVVEQHGLQLLGALQVDAAPGELPGGLLRVASVDGEPVAHLGQAHEVHAGTDLLHAEQHVGHRQLDGLQQPELLSFVDLRGQHVGEGANHDHMKQILALVGRIDVAAQVQLPLRDVIGIVQLQLQEMGCRLFQRIGMIVRLDQVSGEFRIEPRLGEVQSERREDVRLLLVPVHDYPVGVPVKEPLQRGTDAGDHAGFQHGRLAADLQHQHAASRVPGFG